MQRHLYSVIRATLPLLIVGLLATIAQAQMFGVPAAKSDTAWNEVCGLLSEEEPLACLIWNASGELDGAGSESDEWFADDGLQKSLGKLKQALVTLAKEQAPPIVARFAEDVGWKLFSKAGYIEVESFDFTQETANGSLVVRLGDDEKLVADFLADAMAEAEFESAVVDGTTIWSPPEAELPLAIGIYSGHLVAAVGDGQWKTITERIEAKPSAPGWLTDRLASVPVSRRGQFAFGSMAALLEMLPPEAVGDLEFQRWREGLKLDGIKSLSMSSGSDSTSNLSMLHLECDKEGLTSVMDVDAIGKVKLEEIPVDSISAISMKLSPEKIMELVRSLAPPEEFERMMDNIAEESGCLLYTSDAADE